MKLIASPRFPEKRIGYLGMLLLLSEETDVLMLSTNSIKNDLNADNRFVTGLALCTIGNLATQDMSRDLVPEVDKHLKSRSPYLRKKACLAMSRCLTKCPDMAEDFVDRVVTLLKDHSHGVLITVVQLMTQVLLLETKMNEEEGTTESPVRDAFLKLVPSLVKLLKNLLGTGFAPEHDVGGISDPFLQVQILTIFRLLGTNDDKASEEMNDVLAQVATNTESSKNAGNAILYECVQTIMAIRSDDALRVLAVNILGRFLLNRDNNIRYVALNTLARCIGVTDGDDPNSASSALQRHRSTIVDCLKDPDISIRQRALELIYHLVNSENVESLTAELLNYLVLCPREHRGDICTRVLKVVEKYSPDDRWRVDTLITMLTIAGRECDRNVQSAAIIYISRAESDIQAYATHKLVKAVRDDDGSQLGLLVVGIWCVGEYGDLLLKPYSYTPPSSSGNMLEVAEVEAAGSTNDIPVTISFMALDPLSIIKTVEDVTKLHSCTEFIHQTALTSYVKLSERFSGSSDQATHDKLLKLIKKHQGSSKLELQLRSCEYGALLRATKGDVSTGGANDIFGGDANSDKTSIINAAKEALSKMPVVDINILMQKMETFGSEPKGNSATKIGSVSVKSGSGTAKSAEPNLLDLDDIFGGGSAAPAPAPKAQNGVSSLGSVTAPAPAPVSNDADLLADIFSAPAAPAAAAATPTPPTYDPFNPSPAPAPVPVPVAPSQSMANDIFGAPSETPAPTPASEPAPVIVPGTEKNGLKVEFACYKKDKLDSKKSDIVAKFINSTGSVIYGMNLQCAVPKYLSMEMQPPTSTTIPVTVPGQGNEVTQTIKITNNMLGTKKLMLKVKLSFSLNGNKVEHMATCNSFPANDF